MSSSRLKRKKKVTKARNFVAKHARASGAGRHVDKDGEKAPRNRQKKKWRKEVEEDA